MAGPLHATNVAEENDDTTLESMNKATEGGISRGLMSTLCNIGAGGNGMKSRLGTHRHKHKMRAIFRSVVLIALVGVFSFYEYVGDSTSSTADQGLSPLLSRRGSPTAYTTSPKNTDSWNGLDGDVVDLHSSSIQRHLQVVEDPQPAKDCGQTADPVWLIAFYIIGVLYMFLALAIVCDEFFVPALEEISSERHMNLSPDVAGATLMAAGGSAPELFTSLFGTFAQNDVGFGTIVGSAVFNVLFVIAMCCFLSKDVLQLTWWPLFRDSLCYTIGLVVLAIFIGVSSPDVIEIWEAVVLFVMYLLYIVVMYFNERLYTLIAKKDRDVVEAVGKSDENGEDTDTSQLEINATISEVTECRVNADFRRPMTFRAGVLKLLRDPDSWMETAGVGLVSKMAGDVDAVFREVDMDGDGGIDKGELSTCMDKLDCHMTPEQLTEVFNNLDQNKNGKIDEHEFTKWYIASEERIKSKVKETFELFDADKSGTIDRDELRLLLQKLEPRVTEKDIDDALSAMHKTGDKEQVSFEEFSEWYTHSLIYENQKKRVLEEQEGFCQSLGPPLGEGCGAWIKYIILLPIILTLSLTIPDVRRPGLHKWCYVSFFLSIAWIGGYSFFMVDWAEIIGNTLGIPPFIMGLTFLAAGTSVPDLLSSVIVARRGEGDMAVSSSIGSNIFDILVGLPVPWIIFIAYPNGINRVVMSADGVALNVVILLVMLVFIVLAIHWQKWKLTKTLAFVMLLFYAGFLVQAIVLQLPIEACE